MDRSLRTLEAEDIHELPASAREILVTWLLNYDPVDGAKLVGVKGKAEACGAVQQWLVR